MTMTDYTEMILNASVTEELHSHVADTEEAITVNEATRDFTFGANFNPIVGVVGDKKSEMVTFKVPRFIDSHDISECDTHKVFWANIETNNEGEDEIAEVKVSETDENIVLLGWLIDDDVTQDAGPLAFSLRIADHNEEGQVIYRWKTVDGEGLSIADTRFKDEHNDTIRKSYVRLTDQTTGEAFKLYVSKGKLYMEEG